MTYPAFAYTQGMQAILAVIALSANFGIMVMIANLLLMLHGAKASFRQKALFGLITGTIMQGAWIYIVYFVMGQNFSRVQYLLVTSPNPLFALVYCYLGVKILGVSLTHSIRMMEQTYIYFVLVKSVNRLLASIFFVQAAGPYNYLLDAMQQIASYAVTVLLYELTRWYLTRANLVIRYRDSAQPKPRADMIRFIIQSLFIYLLIVYVPVLISEPVMANGMITIVLVLLLLLSVALGLYRAAHDEAESMSAHIHAISRSLDDFRVYKHDFNNILQTYGGYLSMGDLDKLRAFHESTVKAAETAGEAINVNRYLEENPEFYSAIMSWEARADRIGVTLFTGIHANMRDLYLYMDESDLCRVMALILQNAVESAARSENRKVSLHLEQKEETVKLLIISNSTAVDVQAELPQGEPWSQPLTQDGDAKMKAALEEVRRIVNRYDRCSLHMRYNGREFTAYLRLVA